MKKVLVAFLLASALGLAARANAQDLIAVLLEVVAWELEDYTNGWVIASSSDGNPPPDNPATITEYSIPMGLSVPHGVAKEPGLVASGQGGSPNVWFSTLSGDGIVKLDPQTGAQTVYVIPPLPPGFGPHGGITDLRLTPDGKVWFNTGSGDLGALDPATNSGTLYQTNMGFLDWIIVDQFRNVWSTELGGAGNRLIVLNLDTGMAFTWVVGPGSPRPTGLARRKSGDVWWCERGSGMIGRLDPKTNLVRHYSTSIDRLEGCAIDPNGTPDGLVWVTPGFASTQSPDAVGALDPAALTFTRYDTPTQPSDPYGISIGCAGSVAFGEDAAQQVGLLVPSMAVGSTSPSVSTSTTVTPASFAPTPTPFTVTPTPDQATVTTGTSSASTVNGFREYPTLSQGGEGPHLVVIGPNEKIVYSHLFTDFVGPGKIGLLELPPSARCNKQ